MMAQQMMMHRIMLGEYVPPMVGFIPPPPPGSPPRIFIPPMPTSTPPQPEPQLPPSSMGVLVDRVGVASPSSTASYSTHFSPSPQPEPSMTQSSSMDVMYDSDRTASPSSTASHSTYFAPSPSTSYHSFSTVWDGDVEQRPLSPSVFADMEQNGQDLLWDLPREFQHTSSDEADNSDDSADDEGDDVVFVNEYQRPYDVMPAEGTAEHWTMRLFEAEQRARAAEATLRNRVERTSCVVCTRDLLNTKTLRMPCGHLSCDRCLNKIANDAEDVDQIRCPQCREIYINTDNCTQIFFT